MMVGASTAAVGALVLTNRLYKEGKMTGTNGVNNFLGTSETKMQQNETTTMMILVIIIIIIIPIIDIIIIIITIIKNDFDNRNVIYNKDMKDL